MNPFSLDGKTILITGASSGIGRGVAIECSKQGATLILHGRNEDRLKETLSMLEGKNHTIITVDLSTQEDLMYLIDQLPQLQGCVMSVGIPDVSPIKFYKRDKIEKLFNINTLVPMMMTSLMLKKKCIMRGASIVLISSISGVFVGTVGDTAYCATKAAISGFTKASALELAPLGIRVNSINPGLVPTNILFKSNNLISDEEALANKITEYPLKRLGTPQDIAYGAIYLLSDASSWVTGINLVIDGGHIIP